MQEKIIDFAKFSSVKIGSEISAYVIESEADAHEFSGFIVGGANNLLVSPNPPRLGVLGDKFDFIALGSEILRIGAKMKSAKIYNFAKRENLAGFEFLKNIPGTLGGLLTMNAGLGEYEISQKLISVKTSVGEFGPDELGFTYRGSKIPGVILEASFKISRGFDAGLSEQITLKRANQPSGASFGSCFKNPKNEYAGRLIEAAGLKGERFGNVGFSAQHANFLINYGGATYFEMITLINLAISRVQSLFGITLEPEVVIL